MKDSLKLLLRQYIDLGKDELNADDEIEMLEIIIELKNCICNIENFPKAKLIWFIRANEWFRENNKKSPIQNNDYCIIEELYDSK